MMIVATHHLPFPGLEHCALVAPANLFCCPSSQANVWEQFPPSQSAHERIVVTIDETTDYNQQYHDVKTIPSPALHTSRVIIR